MNNTYGNSPFCPHNQPGTWHEPSHKDQTETKKVSESRLHQCIELWWVIHILPYPCESKKEFSCKWGSSQEAKDPCWTSPVPLTHNRYPSLPRQFSPSLQKDLPTNIIQQNQFLCHYIITHSPFFIFYCCCSCIFLKINWGKNYSKYQHL